MTTWNDTKTILLENTTLYEFLQKHEALSESVMYELEELDMNATLTDADKYFINLVLEENNRKHLFVIDRNQMKLDICQAIYDDIQETIKDENLDHGNAETIFMAEDRRILDKSKWHDTTTLAITIEAPHHATVSAEIDLPSPTDTDKCLETYVKSVGKKWYDQLLKAAQAFNANDTFRELWSSNSKTEPLTFADWLKKDQQFFHQFARVY